MLVDRSVIEATFSGLEGVELLQSHEGDRWDRLSPEQVILECRPFELYSYMQIKSELIRSKIEADNFALESLIHSKGRISAGINATSLFDKSRAYAKQPWFTRTCDRVCGMRRESLEVCHTIQVCITCGCNIFSLPHQFFVDVCI